MKKLLSLPANEVHCFHETENVSHNEWFCTSDPAGHRLGSGGGTAWLLDACRLSEEDVLPLKNWLPKEKRILLHAGGQSRRLPAYAPTGKLLTPVPVFRWARGQRLSQNLLNLQLPLYQQIMEKAPESLHTLIASGDVFIRANEPLQEIPKADVVCFGLWADPTVATHHGVFISRRETPEKLDFMLQKPSLQDLATLASNYLCMLDIGIWLLSDRAVELLFQHAHNNAKAIINYELYSEFGLALGNHPKIKDEGLNDLSVAVLPLPGGEFYHFGTSHELISSTLAIQNLVRDQRAIMQRTVKPHPAMFVQNAEIHPKLQARNSDLWIENSCIGSHWTLHHQHVITGIPDNDWTIDLPAGTCMDAVPVGDQAFAARPYGFEDAFLGDTHDPDTLFLGRPFTEWMNERGLTEQDIPHNDDLQMTPLFPLCTTIEELGMAFRWMISEPQLKEGEAIWKRQEKLSANQLMDRANLPRLNRQRLDFRKRNWPLLAANHEKSVFYQLDLNDAAHEFAAFHLPLPAPLTDNAPLMKRIHDAMFRARTLQILHQDDQQQQDKAFELLRKGLTSTLSTCKEPHLNVYHDQIVWGRSPVRIDLAGGWTDTPPFCLYSGGNVVNVAIELNGQPPLQVYIKPSEKYEITLRSIDLGAREVVTKWEELLQFNKVGSPFTIPKAALALAGFAPERSLHRYDSLEDQFFAPDLSLRRYDSLAEQLRAFGSGIEITLLAAIPAGSGLGTSSILAATVLGALSDFCGLGWDLNETGKRTLMKFGRWLGQAFHRRRLARSVWRNPTRHETASDQRRIQPKSACTLASRISIHRSEFPRSTSIILYRHHPNRQRDSGGDRTRYVPQQRKASLNPQQDETTRHGYVRNDTIRRFRTLRTSRGQKLGTEQSTRLRNQSAGCGKNHRTYPGLYARMQTSGSWWRRLSLHRSQGCQSSCSYPQNPQRKSASQQCSLCGNESLRHWFADQPFLKRMPIGSKPYKSASKKGEKDKISSFENIFGDTTCYTFAGFNVAR